MTLEVGTFYSISFVYDDGDERFLTAENVGDELVLSSAILDS